MKPISAFLLVLFIALLEPSESFVSVPTVHADHAIESFASKCTTYHHNTALSLSSDNSDDEEEEVEPGKMRVSEIKAELDLRGVQYADCFEKESLEQRLVEARKSGKADPELLEKFNKQRLEDTFEGRKPVDEAMSDDEMFKNAVGNDGNLPGGLSPEQFKELVGNPEIMAMLQSTKMQEAMKMMMTGGQEELEAAMRSDPELREIVQKLNSALGGKLG